MHVENIEVYLLKKSFKQSLQFSRAGSQTWPLFVFQFIYKHPAAEPQLFPWCHDIQHNDTQNNYFKHDIDKIWHSA